ncbi:SMP-30/gluconolactonase/LRE family protein [Streptomyces sp. RS10V-4]|uniref:SMP-30/gluconolactonase/LRE family protein n=1 Tax=Streptomyces rhizoryzae TaxID=2932493 RepID=UPI00200383EB|nr:SMP-30/gluconolactonase/LRE family protein [Streptomyces rhizoryzae]MCK7622363.1 SMP-30/gluconolactonase/LRE family protein [Streptomyces rhizoryzae]
MSQALTRRTLASAALALVAAVVPPTATAGARPLDASSAGQPARHDLRAPVRTAYDLPGEGVYPEGIAADPRTGDLYIGSYATGAVYKATPGQRAARIFLPSGADGRTTANGLKVDRAGRLWVIDSTAGVAVYDLRDRRLIARFDVPKGASSFVNDLAITPDGSAYLTDSYRGVLYRVTPARLARAAAHGGRGELTTAYDLTRVLPPVPAGGVTLNGIAADPAGRYLLTVDMTAGTLYRVDLASGALRQVALHGGDMEHGDGLEMRGGTLWVVHNVTNTLSRWAVGDDGRSARKERALTDPALQIPTTMVHSGGRLLVVRSQFDKGGPMGSGTPQPFTVAEVDGI